jgi:hypothetical protein
MKNRRKSGTLLLPKITGAAWVKIGGAFTWVIRKFREAIAH